MKKIEVWKNITGYEGLYQVSNYGRVKSFHNNKETILKQFFNRKNEQYLRVGLSKNKKKTAHLVHRLVAEAFIENQDNKEQINHIDGNPSNNYVENLQWATPSENSQHAHDTLLTKDVEHYKKLNYKQVNEIFDLVWHSRLSQEEIAKIYDISRKNVYDIKYKKMYKEELKHRNGDMLNPRKISYDENGLNFGHHEVILLRSFYKDQIRNEVRNEKINI